MEIVRLVFSLLLVFLEFTILIECICSWITPLRTSQLYTIVANINKPFLSPLRKIVNSSNLGAMGLDISPYILYLLISLIRKIFML